MRSVKWPFLWIYAIENNFGIWSMILAPVGIFGFLFLVPLIDRPKGDRHRSKLVAVAGVVMVTLYVGLTIYGATAPPTATHDGQAGRMMKNIFRPVGFLLALMVTGSPLFAHGGGSVRLASGQVAAGSSVKMTGEKLGKAESFRVDA